MSEEFYAGFMDGLSRWYRYLTPLFLASLISCEAVRGFPHAAHMLFSVALISGLNGLLWGMHLTEGD